MIDAQPHACKTGPNKSGDLEWPAAAKGIENILEICTFDMKRRPSQDPCGVLLV